MEPRVVYPLPAFVPQWPAHVRSRDAARAMARRLQKKYADIIPSHRWRFRPVRMVITVQVQG